MRSSIYRRPEILRMIRCRTLSLTRPLSSPSYDQPKSFPLYRPPPPKEYNPALRHGEIDIDSLPSDKKIQKSSKIQLTRKAIQDLPEPNEDELRAFYAAVMESGHEQSSDVPLIEDGKKKMGREERRRVIDGLAHRLMTSGPAPKIGEAGPSRLPMSDFGPSGDSLDTALGIVGKLCAIPVPTESGGRVSLGLVSKTEWAVLLDEMATQSGRAAENLLDLMSSHGTYPDQEQITQVMDSYARDGRVKDVTRIHRLLTRSGALVSDAQHDLLIKAHLQHSPPLVYPAVDLLQQLATTGNPLPQSSYNLLLSHLTAQQSTSTTRSLAWDLFANMRLTAHPTPTPAVYSTMISACAASKDPQPERARDLWIEMNESKSTTVGPERREYDAIIRALSSTKSTYLEAFDLFRQMLAKHTEATFVPFDEADTERWSKYVPTAETFSALLEGTKRAGDLNRARWVLNEVVRLQASGLGRGWKGVDEELMSGVFMTYASWKPVVRRQAVREGKGGVVNVSEEGSSSDVTETGDQEVASMAEHESKATDIMEEPQDEDSSVDRPTPPAHAAPLTAADAIREAKALFHQILHDQRPATEDSGPFTHVRLSTRLINSYLSIHLAHAPSIAAAREAWNNTWSELDDAGIEARPNGWSMMQVLERCAAGEQGRDRPEATEWARTIWDEYLVFTEQHIPTNTTKSAQERNRLYTLGLGPRQIERTYIAIIRALSLSPITPVSDAINLLNTFHTIYPPSGILGSFEQTPPTPFQIRMTDRTRIAESDIPPHILWSDVDVLHQRLVREGKGEVGWLKWVTKTYEVALRKRRNWRLKEGRERRSARATGHVKGIEGDRREMEAGDEDELD